MKFISVRVRTAIVVHGYTKGNEEVVEAFEDESFVEKLLAIERIHSVTEKYILVSPSHGRVMYREYERDLSRFKARLAGAGLLVG